MSRRICAIASATILPTILINSTFFRRSICEEKPNNLSNVIIPDKISNKKILHFVRHAQGKHNAVGEIDPKAYELEENEDAPLSQLGIQQCCEFANEMAKKNAVKHAQLLVVSPHRRALQTATFSFPHLINTIPWVAQELIREQTGAHPCDRRRPISEQILHYPHVDFQIFHDQNDLDEDLFYKLYPDKREPSSSVIQRGNEFIQWLSERSEKEIIIVTHSAYLEHLLDKVIELPPGESPIVRFHNCEMRSYIVDIPSRQAQKHNIH